MCTEMVQRHTEVVVMWFIKGLVTNYGEGATKWERGACEVLPLRKGEGGKSFSHAEGGHNKFFFGGGGAQVSDPPFSHCVPPPPLTVINDQSLRA